MHELLKQHFGYETFRPLQKEIIDHVLEAKDALVLMPTGGGKSLCYQLPALTLEGITLVISPLISLMKDQVDALKTNGIKAAYINSTLSFSEITALQNEARQNNIKLLYVAPERITLPFFQSFLSTIKLSLIAVDEAHCISEWGHDFRPEYRNLKTLREKFPEVPIVALTATATMRVREDIVRELTLRSPKTFLSSFNRPNLSYVITPKKNTFGKLLSLLKNYEDESVIIYCFSRNSAEELASKLNAKGIKAAPYHAGLPPEARSEAQEKFIRDEVNVIVATIAFGMGIDKPDVRLVVHYDLPKSIEGYYQETGRAGRDSLPSLCVLFYSYGDTIKHNYFINEIKDPKEQVQARRKLNQMIQLCNHQGCRRLFLLRYFGENPNFTTCKNCDTCEPNKWSIEAEPKEQKTKPTEPKKLKTVPAQEPAQTSTYDKELFGKLRVLRKELADAKGMPPFIIFGDKSLQEMARFLPHTKTMFSKIFGVGQNKLEEYSDSFIKAITEYANEKHIPLPNEEESHSILHQKNIPQPKENKKSAQSISLTYLETYKLIILKKPLEEIAKIRNFSLSTILAHLELLIEVDNNLDIEYLKPPENKFEKMKSAFEKTGQWNLSPAKNLLDESVTYEDLRLTRLFLQKINKAPIHNF